MKADKVIKELMDNLGAEKFIPLLDKTPGRILEYLRETEKELDLDPNLSPESQEAMEATMSEGARTRAAASVWKRMTQPQRDKLVELIRKAGYPQGASDLEYDLDMELPI